MSLVPLCISVFAGVQWQLERNTAALRCENPLRKSIYILVDIYLLNTASLKITV